MSRPASILGMLPVLAGICCGGVIASTPGPAASPRPNEAASAGSSGPGALTPRGPDSRDDCRARPLSFRPRTGARYRFSAEERHTYDQPGTHRKLYESTIVYTPGQSQTWSAVETGFVIPFEPWRYADPRSAMLTWKLNARGVPLQEPDISGSSEPQSVRHLSLFGFWPVGIVLPATCPGDEAHVSWSDDGFLRTVHVRVAESTAGQIRMLIKLARGSWVIDGELDVASDDGLTGEARLHELGPGAPAVNDNQRVIRIRPE